MVWCCLKPSERATQHDQDPSNKPDHAAASVAAPGGHLLHDICLALSRTPAQSPEKDWLRAFQHSATYLRAALTAQYVGIAATNRLEGYECAYCILASDTALGLSLPTSYLPHLPRCSLTSQQQDECTWDRVLASQKPLVADLKSRPDAGLAPDWQMLLQQDCTWFACVPIHQGGTLVGAMMIVRGSSAAQPPTNKTHALSVQDLETIGLFLGQSLMAGREPALAVALLAAAASQPDIHSLVHAISEHLSDAARVQTQLPMACRVALVHSIGESVVMFAERSSAPTPIHSSRASQSSRLQPVTGLATAHSAQTPAEAAAYAVQPNHGGVQQGVVATPGFGPAVAGPPPLLGAWEVDAHQVLSQTLPQYSAPAGAAVPTCANRTASSTLGLVNALGAALPVLPIPEGLQADVATVLRQPDDNSTTQAGGQHVKMLAQDKLSGITTHDTELISTQPAPADHTRDTRVATGPDGQAAHLRQLSTRDSGMLSFSALYTEGSNYIAQAGGGEGKVVLYADTTPATVYSTGPSVLSQRVHSFLSQETGGGSGSLGKDCMIHEQPSVRYSSGLVPCNSGSSAAAPHPEMLLESAGDSGGPPRAQQEYHVPPVSALCKPIRKSSSLSILRRQGAEGSALAGAAALAGRTSAHTGRAPDGKQSSRSSGGLLQAAVLTSQTLASTALRHSAATTTTTTTTGIQVAGRDGGAGLGQDAVSASKHSSTDLLNPAWPHDVSLRLATMVPSSVTATAQLPQLKNAASVTAAVTGDQEDRKPDTPLANQVSYTTSLDRNSPMVAQMGRRGLPASTPRHAIVVPLRHTLLQRAADRGKGVVVSDVAAYLHKRPAMPFRDIILAHASLPVGSLVLSVFSQACFQPGSVQGDSRCSMSLPGLPLRYSSHRRSSVATLEESMPSHHGASNISSNPALMQLYPQHMQSFGRSDEVSRGGGCDVLAHQQQQQFVFSDSAVLGAATPSERVSTRGSDMMGPLPLLAVYLTYPHTLPAVLLKGLLVHVDVLMQLVGPLVHTALKGPRLGPEWRALHVQLMEQQPHALSSTSGVPAADIIPTVPPVAWQTKAAPATLVPSPVTLKPHLPIQDLSSPFSRPVALRTGTGVLLTQDASVLSLHADSHWQVKSRVQPSTPGHVLTPRSEGGTSHSISPRPLHNPTAVDAYHHAQHVMHVSDHRLELYDLFSKATTTLAKHMTTEAGSPHASKVSAKHMTLSTSKQSAGSDKHDPIDPPTFNSILQLPLGDPPPAVGASLTARHSQDTFVTVSEPATDDPVGSLSFTLEMASAPDRVHALLAGLQDKLSSHRRSRLTASRLAEQGRELGNLKLLELIARGGYGSVYHGTLNGQEVAVKVVLPALDDDISGVAQLRSAMELAVASNVAHPAIVQVVAYFTDVQVLPNLDHVPGSTSACSIELLAPPDPSTRGSAATASHSLLVQAVTAASPRDSPGAGTQAAGGSAQSSPMHTAGVPRATVICMEFCDGGSLSDAVTRGVFKQRVRGGWGASVPDLPALAATLLEVAMALKHLHALRLVHCDVKASNVLLKSSNRDPRGFTSKLSDFGFVSVLAEDGKMAVAPGSDQESSEGGSFPGHPPLPSPAQSSVLGQHPAPRHTAPSGFQILSPAVFPHFQLQRARSSNMPRLPHTHGYQASISRLSKAFDDDTDHVASLINSITTQQSVMPSEVDANSVLLSDPALVHLLDSAPLRMTSPAPRNVDHVTRGGTAVPDAAAPAATDAKVTLLGTYSHMAPEVIAGGARCTALDIYSFGVLMAELIVGTDLLYLGMSSQQVMQRVAAGTLRPQLPPYTPPEYRSLAAECWQQDPALRPTAAQLVTRVKRLAALWPLGTPAPGVRASAPMGGLPHAVLKRSGTWAARTGSQLPAPRYSMAQEAPADDMAFPLHIL